MKKSLLLLLCVFALFEAKAQNSSWMYDFGTAPAAPYTSTTYSSTYLPAAMSGGGNAGVRASSATEGSIELTTSNLAGGSGAELKMTSGLTAAGAKFGLAPFSGTTVATFQCKIYISSGTNGRFILYFGNGSNYTSGSSISVAQTFASLRLSPTSTAVSLDWLSSATSPNYTTTGLSQTTINKNQGYTLKFFMNNSNDAASYVTGSGATLTTHNLPAGTFDIWLDNTKILTNADPGTGLLAQGTIINGMNMLNVGAGSSAPVMYIDDISYTNFLMATPPPPPAIVTNTILNIDYETGTTNSDITGINATDAPASDAAYMVQPGATGNWAIAHKIIGGDANYFSDNNYRSEADAVANLSARYQPGDERRYEFSVLLKDWVPFNGTDITETSIFQLKMSNDMPVPLMIRTKRNNIDCRYGNMDGTNTIINIVNDVQPFVNNWIHFRVDVKWAMDNTGYIKVYMKLPGSSDYSLVNEQLSRRTFTGDPAVGNVGYIKWGVYVAPTGVTRIAYHDDIRIYELNSNSAPVQIWSNTLNGNIDFSSAVTTGNTTNPNVANEENTSPAFFYGTNGGLNTAGIISGRVLLNGWTNKIATSDPATPFNPNQYFEFKLQAANGYEIDFSNLKFTARKGNTADPSNYVMRSSIDGFTSDITAPQSFSGTAATSLTYDLTPLSNVKNPITLRLYWYGSNRTGGTPLVGIDDFTFNGQIKAILSLPAKSDIIRNTNSALCTYTAQGNELDATAINNCSSITYSYSLSGATTATGNGSLANKVFNKGITKVSWTATDECNSSTISYTITVNDTEKPIFTTPAAITVNNDVNQCGAIVTLTQPTATDNCAVANITNNAPALFPIGTTTVTWTATDASGNTAMTTQTVTVNDTQAPSVSSTTSVALCYETSGNYTIPSATATDNCTIKSVTYQITGATSRSGNGLDASGNFNVGLSTITWIVTDNAGNTSTTTTTVTINSIISASVADIYAVSPGGKANTIYLGYGPSSLTLIATPANGTAPYTYSWSNGATTAYIMVNPSTPGVHSYTATITDALGCYVTITKHITVTDILCADGKVKICHSSSPNHDKSLCISTGSVSDHLGHGCYLGTCENISTLSNRKTTIDAKQRINDFMVTLAPNPTKTEFKITITGDPSQIVFVSIFDISGREIKLLKTNSGQTITTGGELKPGMYLAEITQGMNKKTVKLIKQ